MSNKNPPVDVTLKFTPDQIRQALVGFYSLPEDAKIWFKVDKKGSADRMGDMSYSHVFGCAEVQFKKPLREL